jgi:hypothetical protein
MKRLLLGILSIIIFSNIVGQVKYDTCQYIHQFEGEWMNVTGTDTIRVYLRAQRDYYPAFNSIDDAIFGWHEYKQGNTIIESTYENRFMPIIADTITKRSVSIGLMMRSGVDCNATNKSASGVICDYLQSNEPKIVTVTLDSTGRIMTWRQRHSMGYGQFTGAYGMTLPKEFVLIKQ